MIRSTVSCLVAVHCSKPRTEEAEAVGFSEFETSIVYGMNSMATWIKPVSKIQKQKYQTNKKKSNKEYNPLLKWITPSGGS